LAAEQLHRYRLHQSGGDEVQGRHDAIDGDTSMEMITFRNDSTCSSALRAKVLLPNQADPVELEGYLVGVDLKEDVALIVFMKVEDRTIKYLPCLTKFTFIDHDLAAFAIEFRNETQEVMAYKSIFDQEQTQIEREADKDSSNGDENYFVWNGYHTGMPCTKSMAYALAHGLFMEGNKTSKQSAKHCIITKRHIWFNESSSTESFDNLLSVDSQCKDYLFLNLESTRKLPAYQEIARGAKLRMCSKFRSKSRALEALETVVKEPIAIPSELDQCIQYVLSGSSEFRAIGHFLLCEKRRSQGIGKYYSNPACNCGFVMTTSHKVAAEKFKKYKNKCGGSK